MKASEKKTVRWTVFRESVVETYDDAHAATSEVGIILIIIHRSPAPKNYLSVGDRT